MLFKNENCLKLFKVDLTKEWMLKVVSTLPRPAESTAIAAEISNGRILLMEQNFEGIFVRRLTVNKPNE